MAILSSTTCVTCVKEAGDLQTILIFPEWVTELKYLCTVAGIQEEVGRVCIHWGLVRDWPETQSHSNNGRHMGLGAKHVDRDACGLPCRKR